MIINKPLIEYYNEKLEKLELNEFKILSEQCDSSQDELLFEHVTDTPHTFTCTANNFFKRKRCTVCNPPTVKYTHEKFVEEFYKVYDNKEFTVISKYKTNKTPIEIKCNRCETVYSKRPVDILHGNSRGRKVKHMCSKCNNVGISTSELELRDFIKSIYVGEIIYNTKKILSGRKELDIYLPDKNVAIEYDGLYWHSHRRLADKNYHINKTKECASKNIQLIHIFEDEWLDNKELVKNKILHIINESKATRIYARKCTVREITVNEKNDFLKQNHIQGSDQSNIKLGLFYNDSLVSVMTFCKPRISLGHKNSNMYDYELSRFASDNKYCVVGGFSKTLKYFERNYQWTKILTYADIRWSTGNVYIQNGFTHLRNSSPNYFYYDKNKAIKRYHRYNFRKQQLQKLFPKIYDPQLTEFEIMDLAGYDRIYDCGNMVFEYTKK